MPGAFDASAEFDHDPLATADEIQHGGEEALRWLETVATSAEPRRLDLQLVKEIHFRWFETTFPADAGQFRTTRATWHLRNYAFMLDGLRPLVDLGDNLEAYEESWWNARAEDHGQLDQLVLTELASQQPSN